MTKEQAIEIGQRDGVADVENVLSEQGAAVVIATLAGGHVGWDEGAISAAAHKFARVPEEYVESYYAAYASAARSHAERIRDSRERAPDRLPA